MKKIRIFLATSAVLLAIGGAFASQFETTDFTYYKFGQIFQGGEWVDSCIERVVDFQCGTVGTLPCAHPSEPTVKLRPSTNPLSPTFCGPELVKI